MLLIFVIGLVGVPFAGWVRYYRPSVRLTGSELVVSEGFGSIRIAVADVAEVPWLHRRDRHPDWEVRPSDDSGRADGSGVGVPRRTRSSWTDGRPWCLAALGLPAEPGETPVVREGPSRGPLGHPDAGVAGVVDQ